METDFTFNWHERDEDFVKWLTTSMLGMIGNDNFAELSERSAAFTNVKLTVALNGMEVPAEEFLERLNRAMQDRVQRRVREWFEEAQPLRDVQDLMYDFEREVRGIVRRRAAELGIELEEL